MENVRPNVTNIHIYTKWQQITSPIVERLCLDYLDLLLNDCVNVGGIFEWRKVLVLFIAAKVLLTSLLSSFKPQVFYIDAKAFLLGFVSSVFTIALHQQQFSRPTFFVTLQCIVHFSCNLWHTELWEPSTAISLLVSTDWVCLFNIQFGRILHLFLPSKIPHSNLHFIHSSPKCIWNFPH